MIDRRNVFLFRFLLITRVLFVFRFERLYYSVQRCGRDQVIEVAYSRIGAFIYRICTIRLFVGGRVR